ncbi:MAG: hypothetical protein FD177_1187 [Desulfovibrionaceae bacterium]|nr:MAG: hypothetical protein FD177_1187 [Desulfovibrionaceae bacterium]
MRPDEAESITRLTQQEIDFLLDLYPFDSSRCLSGTGQETPPATSPWVRYFPKVHRQGRHGLGLSVAEASTLWRSLLDGVFLREMGLGPHQWVILWLVAVQGGEVPVDGLKEVLGLEAGELDAELAILQSRGILKLLDAGRTGGLATGSVCIKDLAAMQRLITLAQDVRGVVLQGLGDEEVLAMHSTLLKVIDNLRAVAGATGSPTNPPPAPR